MALRLVPRVHKAAHQVGLFLQREPFAAPVSQAEAHVLAHLGDRGASIAEVHASFGHKRSTLTSIIDRLEARGLVAREIHPTDRRSFLLRLTLTGKPLAAEVRRSLSRLERKALARVTDEQLQGFLAVIDALAAASDE